MRVDGGTARPITYYGNPVLHRPCAEVTAFDSDLSDLIADMFASMAEARGVGLAANQIGVGLRVFVVDCPGPFGAPVVAHVINPVLRSPQPDQVRTEQEGCLSVPGQFAEVTRLSTVTVTGVDLSGQPVRLDGVGLLARCLQHEVDHLNGLVYVDHLPKPERRRILAACEECHPPTRRGSKR